jgi:hypothetical protein
MQSPTGQSQFFDPISTKDAIVETYLSYLRSIFSLSDPNLKHLFNTELSEENFVHGPYLEITPPYKKGATIAELVSEGVLSNEFLNLEPNIPDVDKELPLNRPLFIHQERSIRRAVRGENLIISTGTGSGKTESFLIPILNHLMRIKEQNKTIPPGINAIFLYPMNALVNDQLKRLRNLLKGYQDITFGRYTGETPISTPTKQIPKEDETPILKNELLTRKQMWENPPHLLFTNYSMLEFLLLRPDDSPLFEKKTDFKLSFIVLDEIHTYTGAKGIEIGMLLRRLQQRVVGVNDFIQCIGTSATLAGSKEDFGAVISFANNIFNQKFTDNSIIQSEINDNPILQPWKCHEPHFFIKIKKILHNSISDLEKIDQVIHEAHNCRISEQIYSQANNASIGNFSKFLYHLLKDCQDISTIWNLLRSDGTMGFSKAAHLIFPDEPDAIPLISALIEVASFAKPGIHDHHLLPVKYHLFTKAPEGAYIAYTPNPIILLEPHEWYTYDNDQVRVFEIASCKECGAIYITGKISGNSKKELKPYFAVNHSYSASFLVERPTDATNTTEYVLCTKCGEVVQKKHNQVQFVECNCNEIFHKIVYKVTGTDASEKIIHTCPKCMRTHNYDSIIGGFHIPRDKISAIVAMEFFQRLPPNNKGLRKLISFTDSRQDAAFFPVALNREYERVQMRSFLVHLIEEKKDKVVLNEWRPVDLADSIKHKIIDTGDILSDKEINTPQRIENLSQKYVIEDFIRHSYERGPEALGLCAFEPIRPHTIEKTFLHDSPWNLNDDEVWDLFCIFADIFRQFRAVSDSFPLIDPFGGVPGGKGAYRLSGPQKFPNGFIKSWESKSPYLNKPLDILRKIGNKVGNPDKDLRSDLTRIWTELFQSGQFKDYFLPKLYCGPVFVLNTNRWKITSFITHKEKQWYYCPMCNRMTQRSLKGICPTYRCPETLIPCNPVDMYGNSYYWKMYQGTNPTIRLRAAEHTAQLSPERGAEVQNGFMGSDIDLLSCSTTFELGVDLGELQGVFLKNVPPTPANYIQRVGRAGRRVPPAYAVTTCHRTPHDMAHYHEPERMIRGKIHPPQFSMENEKIVRRHLVSVALSRFFRLEKMSDLDFKTINSFFQQEGGVERFRQYLIKKDPILYNDLISVIPPSLDLLSTDKSGTWKFYSDLFDDEGIIHVAVLEYRYYIAELNRIRDSFRKEEKDSAAAYVGRIIKSEQEQNVIAYLSNHNIIPKYGFPVDVVELKLYSENKSNTGGKRENNGFQSDIRLQRDLRIALSEYAPGNQVIANGKMWTSRYLRMIPEYNLPEYSYCICKKCNTAVQWKFGESEQTLCPSCHELLEKARIYLTPKYGFIDNELPQEVPYTRPEKSSASRVYYLGEESQKQKPIIIQSSDDKITVKVKVGANGRLLALNDAHENGFWICKSCGYGMKVEGKEAFNKTQTYKRMGHQTVTRKKCNGELHKYSLGHNFQTDVIIFEISGNFDQKDGFWESLLYSLIEGICYTLDIDRRDIDGCLYQSLSGRQIIIFDDVPGGAGLVRQCTQSEDLLLRIFKGAASRLKNCSCGGKEAYASCYGCLKQYKNQYCHELLNRRYAIDFFDRFN